MRRIYKYVITPDWGPGKYAVSLPSGAKILNAQFQAGFIVLWAEVDPTNVVRVTTHIIYLLFTGDEVPNVPLTYINTTQEPKSGIVVHIYEAK